MDTIILLKGGYTPWITSAGFNRKTYRSYLPKIILSKFVGSNICNKFDREMQKYNGSVDDQYYCIAGTDKYGNWKIKHSWAEDINKIKFEDDEFYCLVDYHDYLTSCYGDYMITPLVEKRGIGHSIIELDFGKE